MARDDNRAGFFYGEVALLAHQNPENEDKYYYKSEQF
jgi:hypothetical protein